MAINRDLYNNLKVVQMLKPQSISGSAGNVDQEVILDTAGYGSASAVWNVGASGDTLSGSLKLDGIIRVGDASDLSDATFPAAGEVQSVATYDATTGIFQTVDNASTKDEQLYKVGYLGAKRYIGIRIKKTGTHTIGTICGVNGLLGNPDFSPVS